jgi:hypothetical protein
VIEVDVLGELMNPNPLNRLATGVAVADLFKERAVRLHSCVTIHTDLRRGNCRVGSLIYGVVTVIAIHPHVAGVQLVAVREGLYRLISRFENRRVSQVRKKGDTYNHSYGRYDAANANIFVNYLRKESRH